MEKDLSSNLLDFLLKLGLVGRLGLLDVLYGDFLLAEWTSFVVLEPVLNTALVEVVLDVAGEGHH